MLAVRLGFADGKTEFVDDAHVHGIKDDNLLLPQGNQEPASTLT